MVRRMLGAPCWWIRSRDRMTGNRRMEARSRGTELAPVGLQREYKRCCGTGEESKGGSSYWQWASLGRDALSRDPIQATVRNALAGERGSR